METKRKYCFNLDRIELINGTDNPIPDVETTLLSALKKITFRKNKQSNYFSRTAHVYKMSKQKSKKCFGCSFEELPIPKKCKNIQKLNKYHIFK